MFTLLLSLWATNELQDLLNNFKTIMYVLKISKYVPRNPNYELNIRRNNMYLNSLILLIPLIL